MQWALEEGGVQNEQGGETLQGLVTARGYLQDSTRQRPGTCVSEGRCEGAVVGGAWESLGQQAARPTRARRGLMLSSCSLGWLQRPGDSL